MKSIFKQLGLFSIAPIVLYLLIDLLVFPIYTRHAEEFELADFTEKSIEEVREEAEELGFELIIKDSTYNPLYSSGVIIAQKPNAFSRVKYGRRIYLTISLGDRPIFMPKLIGTSLNNATFLVEGKGLVVGDILTEYSSTYDKDLVMMQSHQENTKLIAGDTVGFTVSIGEDLTSIPIPDYTGKPFSKAQKTALARGFIVKKELGEIRTDLVPNTIIKQSLEAGSFAELNETMVFTVSQ